MKPKTLDRRQWLQGAALAGFAAASAGALWLPQHSWSQSAAIKFDSNPFKLGVASGSPTHDSVVLWTRLQDGRGDAIPVRWEIAEAADGDIFTRIVQKGISHAYAELGHSVHVEVQNLRPDRWYVYRFMVGDAVSAVGRTRTFPAAGQSAASAAAAKLRLAYASCQRWEAGYFSAYKHMLAENLDAVLFLGDYIYEYPGNPVTAVRLPAMTPSLGFVLTLDDYRARYAQYKTDADLQAMHAACPWLVTWDDHEVQNDYAGLTAGNSGVADVFSNPAHFAQRRAAAYQAFYENMPIRAVSLQKSFADLQIYSRVDFGNLATLYMLDARQYKSPQVCNPNGRLGSSIIDPASCQPLLDPSRTMLGAQQEAWLSQALANSASAGQTWNVLGQQSLFGQRDNLADKGQSFFNDGWDGYPAARTRLTDALQRHRPRNPVFLGGDVHENWVGHVKADYSQTAIAQASSPIGVEFCGTSITSPSGSAAVAKTPERLAENPHFVFADAKMRGYGVVELTPKRLTTTLRVVDDVRQAATKISTLAQFEVQAGRAVVERA